MKPNYIILTSPQYNHGEITDEKFYINASQISEVLPHDMVAVANNDEWKTIVIMANGNKYRVVETTKEVHEKILLGAV